MKREARAPWVALTKSGYVLCCHCRYGDAAEDYMECRHTLDVVADGPGDCMEPLNDCWGFRPETGDTVEAAAERVRRWGEEARG
jgi:hypothetical protein